MEKTEVYNQSIAELYNLSQGYNISTNMTSIDDANGHSVSDVWVSIALILMTLACIGCLCSCLLYYKFKSWKDSGRVNPSGSPIGMDRGSDINTAGSQESNLNQEGLERRPSKEGPPSYTFVTGLPTYEQAITQCGSPIGSNARSERSTPLHFSYLQGAGSQMSRIGSTEEVNRTKGVYPNPPLTPPVVSPARVPTSSATHPVVEVHHFKI